MNVYGTAFDTPLTVAELPLKAPSTNDLFAFLTTEANPIVGAVHAKAMPVVLTKPDEIELWMSAPEPEALKLQRALPDNGLRVVARGQKQDGSKALVSMSHDFVQYDPPQASGRQARPSRASNSAAASGPLPPAT